MTVHNRRYANAVKAAAIAGIGFTAVVLIGVAVMFYSGQKEPMVSVSGNNVRIDAMYGLTIDAADIAFVSLIEKSMNDMGPGRRTNGYGFGDTLKGHCYYESLGNVLVFVKTGSSPTICIERGGDKDVYISFGDGEKTKELYRELIEVIPSK